MKIIITKTGRRHYYYEKGDVIKDVSKNTEHIVLDIAMDKKSLLTEDRIVFPLTTDIRPTKETLKSATVEDRRVVADEVSMDEIMFAPLRPDARIPSRDEENGWYDVYACFDEDYVVIPPHTCKLIPTGIMSAFNKRYRVSLGERGSTGTKLMEVRAGKIDSGYRGEWFVALSNGGNHEIIIKKDNVDMDIAEGTVVYSYSKAICQAELNEVPQVKVVVKTPEELKAIASKRGDGKLGSSGK